MNAVSIFYDFSRNGDPPIIKTVSCFEEGKVSAGVIDLALFPLNSTGVQNHVELLFWGKDPEEVWHPPFIIPLPVKDRCMQTRIWLPRGLYGIRVDSYPDTSSLAEYYDLNNMPANTDGQLEVI